MAAQAGERRLLPRDIWPLKALIAWGSDTQDYREQVYHYWGAYPYQFHACTEGGIMAVQSWTRQGMTFIPNANFYEFIPEEEWDKSRSDIFYVPRTVLLPDVRANERYELMITNIYGMPFIRYRSGHLIRITELEDTKARIYLPQMVFETRSADLIEINGFTRICEKSISQAIAWTGLRCEEWVASKETREGKPRLHLYMELDRQETAEDLAALIHSELMNADQGYYGLTLRREISPLRVTVLKPGSFKAYARVKRDAGWK
jgi:phenylacetate-coenzyme A ligase PaaK-like adenylate-forming protein